MKQEARQKVRVLFFAWGESIHARRRIGLFCDDPSFEVGVVSTFAYDFNNAENYYLSSGLRRDSLPKKIMHGTVALPLYLLLRLFGGVPLAECSYLIRDYFLIRQHVRRFGPDVIFLQTLMYPCYMSYFWLGKIPVAVTFWNGDVIWWAKWRGIERLFKKQIVRYGVRRADAITVNSRVALQACLEYGIDADKVKLIRYPGVNLQKFKPCIDRLTVREQLGVPTQGRIVFCPRGLADYHNSDIIIEAIADVVKLFPDTLFIFLVQDEASDEWQAHLARARELGVAVNVAGVGKIPWADMPAYYQAADVMVSISSNDSLPNCMLEAMACGVPVIMGDIPQIMEWVKDGENGYSVPPRDSFALADRIARIFTDRAGALDLFINKNIELVRQEADSQIVAGAVRKLVHDLAKGGK